jgi:CO/xanthine dehydrogenase FAD-binding subunit
MILEYLRPKNMDEAIAYLQRENPKTVPLGGGTLLSRSQPFDCAVVDLQALGLDGITQTGNKVRIGSTTTLQTIVDSDLLSPGLRHAAIRETGRNLRESVTIGGVVASGKGQSTFLTALLAADATLVWEPGEKRVALGDWLPVRNEFPGVLIRALEIPENIQIAGEYVGKTPVDRPFLCTAVAKWPSGRMRAAIGGGEEHPVLIIDGTEKDDLEVAAKNAYSHLGKYEVKSEYLQELLKTLLHRIVQQELSK